MDTKLCTVCGVLKDRDKFKLNSDGSIRKHVCKKCYSDKHRAQLKLEMLEAFGWKCQCCGENHPQFLSLDHIQNDGAEHRAKYDSRNNDQVLADARREGWPKDRYQLLCMNCNTAKGFYGKCPHESGLTAERVIEDLRSKIFHTGKTLQNYVGNKGLALGPKKLHERYMAIQQKDATKLIKTLSPEQARLALSLLGLDPKQSL